MIDFIIQETIKRVLSVFTAKGEKEVIIKEYLLPESIHNLHQLSKVHVKSKGITFNLIDVAIAIKPGNFPVGEYHLPLFFSHMEFSNYSDVKEKIKYSRDKDYTFFRKLYRAFKIVDTKKDINEFSMSEYDEYSTAVTTACEKFGIDISILDRYMRMSQTKED